MIKQLLNWVIAKYRDLSMSPRSIICDPPQEFDAKGESTLTTRLHDTLSVS